MNITKHVKIEKLSIKKKLNLPLYNNLYCGIIDF